MRALITNGGTHSPEKWAVATAETICPIAVDPNQGDRALAAKKLQTAIAEALLPHHSDVQSKERHGLKTNGDDHFDTEIDPSQHVDEAMVSIVAAAKGTPWEDHFGRPDVQAAIRQEIGSHFATHMDVERQHHADKHPHHLKARAYKDARHPAPAAEVEA